MESPNILYINLGKELEALDNLKDIIYNKLEFSYPTTLQIMVAKTNLISQINAVKSRLNALKIDTNKVNFEDYEELLEILEKRSKIY